MIKKRILLACLLAASLQLSADDEIRISFEDSGGDFLLVSPAETTTLVVAAEDDEVVGTAAQMLAGDIAAVTGRLPEVVSSVAVGSEPVIAGTLGRSPLIDSLASVGKIEAGAVRGRWEVYGIQLVEAPVAGVARALVVYGSMPRGTAYGLLELSRGMGVSPFIWWADVAPAHRQSVYVAGRRMLSREPSVRYRGIFINDEDWGLTPWAARTLDKEYNNIGPNTYARVMELLLRLRANMLWPAMHPCSQAFWDNKDNLPVARRYGIMLGSSHCEQMLRNNEWEWRRAPWNGTNEDWNYVSNTAKIQHYWEERTQQSRGYEAMYTLGMRGVHDWGISGYPTTEDKVRGLTEIIAFQRSLIQKHIGAPEQVPQLFIPYKEVLDAYNAGLQVPEDVTLCWVDDNHGYIRQLPTPQEQVRPGGNGVYYHLSYWGAPQDYLWLCSHSPALVSYELSRAYAQGVRALWVINVGDIKPAEAELEFCMDLAWDVSAWQPERAHEYSRHWAAETFGQELAEHIAAIRQEYYRLAAAGKPEHVFAVSYTLAQQERRMADYAALAARVDEVKRAVPAALADAYFQLVEYPVKGAYYMNVKTFRDLQSQRLADCGQHDLAQVCARAANHAYRQITALTVRYNEDTSHGKWKGIMSAAPRGQRQFSAPRAPMSPGDTLAADSLPPALESHGDAATAASALSAAICAALPAEPADTLLPATSYLAASPGIVGLQGLGVSGHSVGIWPLDLATYTAAQAPHLEYKVPVWAGENTITVRCLPTFPVEAGRDLRLALSIDGSEPKTISLKTEATKGKWRQNVLRGYNDATITCTAVEAGTVLLRVALLDPGVVVSDICVEAAP